MKKIIYLTILILTVFASCKDDVETPKYSLDENGDVVVANDNKALRTTDLFNSIVCGHCWTPTDIEIIDKRGEGLLGTSIYTFDFGTDSCTIYSRILSIPANAKWKAKISYDENTGKLFDNKNRELLTILSINADKTITAYDKVYNPYYIITFSPMSEEAFKELDAQSETLQELYDRLNKEEQ